MNTIKIIYEDVIKGFFIIPSLHHKDPIFVTPIEAPPAHHGLRRAAALDVPISWRPGGAANGENGETENETIRNEQNVDPSSLITNETPTNLKMYEDVAVTPSNLA